VDWCLVFANRGLGGRPYLEQNFGVSLMWVTDTKETLRILRSNQKISGKEEAETLRQMELA
jgi:hypothetical protein